MSRFSRKTRVPFYWMLVLVVGTWCLATVMPTSAYAAQSSTIAGANRFETAAKEAVQAYPGGCDRVIVVG
ncbi:MAG: hypothetical protein RSB04_11835, partial [Gordonibacter sp.]|uniref:hypothetical protein n=1 Tax=Gordonibacter sp. TaxID=1968902 RepID=UPI002FCAE018